MPLHMPRNLLERKPQEPVIWAHEHIFFEIYVENRSGQKGGF